MLEDIIARYPNPLSESIEARYRLLEIAEATGNNEERVRRLQDLVYATLRRAASAAIAPGSLQPMHPSCSQSRFANALRS